jgi:hypothetical protein
MPAIDRHRRAPFELADRLDGKVPQAVVGDAEHPSVFGQYMEWLAWIKQDGIAIAARHGRDTQLEHEADQLLTDQTADVKSASGAAISAAA